MSWDTDGGRMGDTKAASAGRLACTTYRLRSDIPPRDATKAFWTAHAAARTLHSHILRTRSPLPSPLLRPIPAAGIRV